MNRNDTISPYSVAERIFLYEKLALSQRRTSMKWYNLSLDWRYSRSKNLCKIEHSVFLYLLNHSSPPSSASSARPDTAFPSGSKYCYYCFCIASHVSRLNFVTHVRSDTVVPGTSCNWNVPEVFDVISDMGENRLVGITIGITREVKHMTVSF